MDNLLMFAENVLWAIRTMAAGMDGLSAIGKLYYLLLTLGVPGWILWASVRAAKLARKRVEAARIEKQQEKELEEFKNQLGLDAEAELVLASNVRRSPYPEAVYTAAREHLSRNRKDPETLGECFFGSRRSKKDEE